MISGAMYKGDPLITWRLSPSYKCFAKPKSESKKNGFFITGIGPILTTCKDAVNVKGKFHFREFAKTTYCLYCGIFSIF